MGRWRPTPERLCARTLWRTGRAKPEEPTKDRGCRRSGWSGLPLFGRQPDLQQLQGASTAPLGRRNRSSNRTQAGAFQGLFHDQTNINDEDVLMIAVESAGLDPAEAAEVLADQRYAGKVRAEENYWTEQNITGVPAFIINGKYMIPGAQDAETFGRVLERSSKRSGLRPEGFGYSA
ncbi:MAG: DsbA family protein [Sphingomonadales bacterium]|nr:DsbA family protein [Sphingomonadales bacterium]